MWFANMFFENLYIYARQGYWPIVFFFELSGFGIVVMPKDQIFQKILQLLERKPEDKECLQRTTKIKVNVKLYTQQNNKNETQIREFQKKKTSLKNQSGGGEQVNQQFQQ